MILSTVFVHGQVLLDPACAQTTEIYGVTGLPGSEFIWTVRGGNVTSGDGTDSVTIQWGSEPGSFTIDVMEYTSSGCFNVPSIALITILKPHVELGPEEQHICTGDTMKLNVGTGFQSPYEITWHNGSSGSEYIANKAERIIVEVIDGNGCRGSDTVYMLVNNLPGINLGNDTLLCNYDEPLMIYYSQVMANSANYREAEWRINGEVTYNDYISLYPADNKIDTLFAAITDVNGCEQTDTMIIYPCNVADRFKDMPNTITPGSGTQANDVWNIAPYVREYPEAILEIFDRWGRLVYHTKNVATEPWDGTSNGRPMPMDSYYFVLKLGPDDTRPVIGTINLIK